MLGEEITFKNSASQKSLERNHLPSTSWQFRFIGWQRKKEEGTTEYQLISLSSPLLLHILEPAGAAGEIF